jgi:hypothetical protein
MIGERHDETRTIGTRRSRKAGLLLMGAAVLTLAALGVWMSPGGGHGREEGRGLVRTETGNAGSVGTTGRLGDDEVSAGQGPSASGIIHELETITGANDGHQFVGRRVDLHVPVQQHINDVAFWAGMGDNRLLVVLARDNRDGQTRQVGESSSTGLGALRPGQQATVSGSIQQVPYAEAMYSWGLTNADRSELMDRRIYLKADSVSVGEQASAAP